MLNVAKENGRRYTEEFKKQIVELYQAGSSVNHLSGEYGVSKVTIYKWIKNFSTSEELGLNQKHSKEYHAMKKRISELEMENEILKKATAIFARKR